MATDIEIGDVVRRKGDDRELTVEGRYGDVRLRCVRLTEDGLPFTYAMDASALDLVWRGERLPVLFRPGDVVQLPSAGTNEYMTVGRGANGRLRCLWFGKSGFVAHRFAAAVLWATRPADDATARFDAGDIVMLRSGGPPLTIEQGGTSLVRCACPSGEAIRLDARTLEFKFGTAHEMTASGLIDLARRRGVDLGPICHSHSFIRGGRFAWFWCKTRGGVVYYSAQGPVKLLPQEFRQSASAFRGMWHEAGHFDDLEQAFVFVRAWLLDGREVDELPSRSRCRYGIG